MQYSCVTQLPNLGYSVCHFDSRGAEIAHAAHRARMVGLDKHRRKAQAEKKQLYRKSLECQARAKRAKTDPHVKWGLFQAQAKHRKIDVSMNETTFTRTVKQECFYCSSSDTGALRCTV
jgi:hypothetical protein